MARANAPTAPSPQVGPRPGAPLPRLEAVPGRGLSSAVGADVLAVPVARGTSGEGVQPRAGAADAAVAYGVDLADVCERAAFTASAGAVLHVHGARPTAAAGVPEGLPPLLVLVGTGDGTERDLRRAGAGLARAVRGQGRVATPAVADAGRAGAQAFAEGLLLASWTPPRSGLTEGPRPAVGSVVLLGCSSAAPLERAATAARATWRVRDLAVTPSSTKDPQWVADQARALAADVPGTTVEVLDEAALAAGGFGGLLAVGGGSVSPPRLVRVTWTPPGPQPVRHVVLVGKGITYDSGGLDIKPREAMVPMKTDMAGAAVVLAVVLAAAEVGLPARVTALLPLAENAFGGASYRPGDVITTRGGTTVEVANTDAEGRLVLADALALADAELDPDLLVDVATLTGAASLGLGKRHAALFTDDDALAAALVRAADETGERVWRMPLVEDYRPALESTVADLRHVPAEPPGAGAVTAALFLREFAGARRWAHLDIAGPARADRDEHEVVKGATGFGARLLLRWLEDVV